MKNDIFARFAVAATLMFAQCMLANADSFKVVAHPAEGQQATGDAASSINVVSAPQNQQEAAVRAGASFKVVHPSNESKQVQPDVAQAAVPSPDEFNPAEIGPSQGVTPMRCVQPSQKSIEIAPGYIGQTCLDFTAASVHVGDDSLIEVSPLNDHTMLVRAKKIPTDAVNRTNFFVTSADGSRTESYEVTVKQHPFAREIQIHTRAAVENYLTYDCDNADGCGYPTAHQVLLEPLPTGYSRQDVTHRER
jgi:hypothetical protein